MMDDFHLNYEDYLLKKTMSISELIDILKTYPKEMKVMFTWESTLKDLRKENIYEAKNGALYLDADNNSYKREFAKENG